MMLDILLKNLSAEKKTSIFAVVSIYMRTLIEKFDKMTKKEQIVKLQ